MASAAAPPRTPRSSVAFPAAHAADTANTCAGRYPAPTAGSRRQPSRMRTAPSPARPPARPLAPPGRSGDSPPVSPATRRSRVTAERLHCPPFGEATRRCHPAASTPPVGPRCAADSRLNPAPVWRLVSCVSSGLSSRSRDACPHALVRLSTPSVKILRVAGCRPAFECAPRARCTPPAACVLHCRHRPHDRPTLRMHSRKTLSAMAERC